MAVSYSGPLSHHERTLILPPIREVIPTIVYSPGRELSRSATDSLSRSYCRTKCMGDQIQVRTGLSIMLADQHRPFPKNGRQDTDCRVEMGHLPAPLLLHSSEGPVTLYRDHYQTILLMEGR
jgi:hypothetical protein